MYQNIKILEKFLGTDISLDSKIWRYMSIEKFEKILQSKSLYFASAEQFVDNDNHEGAITEKEYQNRLFLFKNTLLDEDKLKFAIEQTENAFKPLREYNKISCWHLNNEENFAMWSYYQGKNKGVAIVSTIKDLLESLGEYKIEDTYGAEDINIGKVNYINYETDEMSERYGFLTPYFYKRKFYEYENELRLIISLRSAVEYGVKIPKNGINVPFCPKTGIRQVILSPQSNSEDIKKIEKIVLEHNFNLEIRKSELSKSPKF